MVNEKWVIRTSLVQTKKFAEEVRKQLFYAVESRKEVYEKLRRNNPQKYQSKIEALDTIESIIDSTVRVVLKNFVEEETR